VRFDRKGYPPIAGDTPVDPVTELVNVVDVYEAVTAKRPYKRPFPPEIAANLLLKGAGTEFNPVLVDLFLGFFGVYPIGTHVRLEDGTQCKVVSQNRGSPFRPVVLPLADREGLPIAGASPIDTSVEDAAGRGIVESVADASQVGMAAVAG
jgi:hypothetical protein